jgi:hypothetical protein
MEKSLEEKVNSNHFFMDFTGPIHINFGRNIDGGKAQDFQNYFRILAKNANG